ncbi:MAG: hypothetical protein AAGB51_06460 [Planctomycetota bacterium]
MSVALTLAHPPGFEDLVMRWSLVETLEALQGRAAHNCTACFSGEYRLDIDQPVTTEVVSSGQGRMFK